MPTGASRASAGILRAHPPPSQDDKHWFCALPSGSRASAARYTQSCATLRIIHRACPPRRVRANALRNCSINFARQTRRPRFAIRAERSSPRPSRAPTGICRKRGRRETAIYSKPILRSCARRWRRQPNTTRLLLGMKRRRDRPHARDACFARPRRSPSSFASSPTRGLPRGAAFSWG
jgi:hypothetical protein